MNQQENSLQFKIVLAFAAIYVIWGTTYLAIALSIQTLPPFASGGIRFVIAALLVFAGLRARHSRPFEGIDMKRAAISGATLTGLGNGLVIWAQQGLPSGIAALIVAVIPIIVLLVEILFFSGKLPTARAALGMSVALLGVITIVIHTHDLSGSAQPIYVAAILCAVVSWSFGTVFQRRACVPSQRIMAFTCAQMFFGGLLQLSLATISGEWRHFNLAMISFTSIGALLYLVVFGSIIALSSYTWLLTKMPAQKVATYALVNPVVALVLGAFVLNEKITVTAVLAALGVLIGIALVLFPSGGLKWKLWRQSEAT